VSEISIHRSSRVSSGISRYRFSL